MLLVLVTVQNIILIPPELSIAMPSEPFLYVLMICRVRIAFYKSLVALSIWKYAPECGSFALKLLKSPLLLNFSVMPHEYPPLDKSKEIDELSRNYS